MRRVEIDWGCDFVVAVMRGGREGRDRWCVVVLRVRCWALVVAIWWGDDERGPREGEIGGVVVVRVRWWVVGGTIWFGSVVWWW